ncbi:MAG: Site-specific recombinase XerD [Bacteroidales bacterium]
MLNEATTQGYNTSAYYNRFHVFTEEADTIYLTETELQQLKDTDFSKIPYLDRVRDWFLLLAWTGSRFSDLEKVAKTDIKDGFITFRQQKTNNKVVIPLHPVVLEIMEKYSYNLPEQISNQKFNAYIKEACRIAEINDTETMTRTIGGQLVTEKFKKWEHVSSHTGRRSFCTNMYKRGLPTLMIMSISGHRTEKSFLKYIKVKQEEHAEMMKKAWDKIYT